MIKKATNYFLPLQKLTIVSILILFFSCSKPKPLEYIPNQETIIAQKTITDDILEKWQYKDIIDDSIPGISLEKAFNTVLKDRKGEQVIVAVLDTDIDISHKDLKSNIWTNKNEIRSNDIDDDKNGFIDDFSGWNFYGNKEGAFNNFIHYDYTRFVKANKERFDGKSIEQISQIDSMDFIRYKNAEKKLNNNIASAPEALKYANNIAFYTKESKENLAKYFKKDNYTIKSLDSIKHLYPKDTLLETEVLRMSNFIKYNFTENYVRLLKVKAEQSVKKQYNLAFDERGITGDNPNDIADMDYGNNQVNKNIDIFHHGTEVSSMVVDNKFTNVKIMSVPIAPYGSTHDKDIALGIRYAVNNGAKVINMSFGKDYSLHEEWVDEAIKYAESKDVLIITSAGNNAHDLDNPEKFNFPDDRNNDNNEFSDNFMKIGGSTYKANEKLYSRFSNFGKTNVDVFAPATRIKVAAPHNKYMTDSGTSLAAALTSKIAALIYSYHPNLNASQVKHIIMDSGVEYTFPVKTATKEDKNKMTPFNELSKSGKIVNAYNALIMADSISKGRK